MIQTVQNAVMWAALAALGMIALVALGAYMGRKLRALRRLGWGFALFAVCAVFYAGGKNGSLTFDTTYLTDTGSYLTNDTVHVSIAKRSAIVPDDTTILVHARHYTLSNSTDWIEVDVSHVLTDYPMDFHLADATNYDVTVYADFSPTPTVHTNGVWQIKGFTIPASGGGRHAFPNTRTKTEIDQ